jgi:hypothetical protein
MNASVSREVDPLPTGPLDLFLADHADPRTSNKHFPPVQQRSRYRLFADSSLLHPLGGMLCNGDNDLGADTELGVHGISSWASWTLQPTTQSVPPTCRFSKAIGVPETLNC